VTAFERFPILNWLALHNPITLALYAIRNLLLGDWGWSQTLPVIGILLPVAAGTLGLGVWAFRAALRREQRRGTLGLY
jgi:hypothetical protein